MQFMGLQRVGHDWATDLIWYKYYFLHSTTIVFYLPMSRFLSPSVTNVLISLISSIQSWFGGRLNEIKCGSKYKECYILSNA